MAEHRIVTYTPAAEEDRQLLDRLRALDDPMIGCSAHGRPLSTVRAEAEQAAAQPKIPLAG
jgi:hypothetical protein